MGLGRIVRFITGTLGSRHLRQKTTPHVRIKTRSELTMYKKFKSWSKLTFKPDISYPISSRKPIGSRKTHISSKDVESGQFVMWQSKWMAAPSFWRFHHPPWNHCATRKDEVNSGCFWKCGVGVLEYFKSLILRRIMTRFSIRYQIMDMEAHRAGIEGWGGLYATGGLYAKGSL
jgi:hypothetical protein